VCKNDINVVKIQLPSTERDICLLEGSLENAHGQLEDLGGQVDGFMSSLRTYSNWEVTNHRALGLAIKETGEVAHVDHESLLAKFARTSDIINKKFVQLDTKLEKVVDLVGEKIKKEVREIAHNFGEAMEVEEVWRATSEAKVALLEGRLDEALGHIANLVGLVTNLQGCVGELEDAVMEDTSDEEGHTAMSTSSLEFDPVENMVAIPIPPPVIHNVLISIKVPEAFIPPSLWTTPSPPYVQALHDGVPEYWADPEVGSS
jgi:hypothetical protein